MIRTDTILDALKAAPGKSVSGAALAKELGVSRAAVWKHMAALKRRGYRIVTIPFQGYRLAACPDLMLSGDIKAGLKTRCFGKEVYSFQETSSTSDAASALARGGALEGTVVVADKQDQGRGRMGRLWESAPGLGIWMSIILRPHIPPMNAPQVTITSAVAVAELLRQETALEPAIEWPNDIVIQGRKVCGILTEMVAEQDRVEFVILGIGLNVNHAEKDFSPQVRNVATSLYLEDGKRRDRTVLVQRLLERLETVYDMLEAGKFNEIATQWSAHSCTLGRRVQCSFDGKPVQGTAESLALDGALLVRDDTGELYRVTCGDVLCI